MIKNGRKKMLCYFPLTTKKIIIFTSFFLILLQSLFASELVKPSRAYMQYFDSWPKSPNIHAHAENVLNTFKKNTLGLNESQKILNLASNLLTLKIKDFKPQS